MIANFPQKSWRTEGSGITFLKCQGTAGEGRQDNNLGSISRKIFFMDKGKVKTFSDEGKLK